ncbi:hypothetical protein [Kitasatospora sp. NPDC088783]|uniref:hypothetical protein n=1 Tax=Kitasatospora sp. NPDC088783 TaxID=3364077 RepID=UPI0037F58433
MAGRDLRAPFGSNDRSVGAEEAFTNREGQWAVFSAALGEHLVRVGAEGFDVQDLEGARCNVLVFHGIGGVGKSALSRKLEAALGAAGSRPAQWGEPSWPAAPRLLPVRTDLARSAGTDSERLVLTLRPALAGLDRALPAFDLALGRYWEHNHPGESLEEYLRRAGLVSKLAKALPDQLQGALSKAAEELALPGLVGSAVGQVATALVRVVRERRSTARALAGCPRLADLLEVEPDLEALSFSPHLLAYEIDRLPAKKAVVPVVLLDTFEDTGDRTHREPERLMQRVVWLMPNVLFAITGRSWPQWADEALQGQLDYTGPGAWPQLAARVPAARGEHRRLHPGHREHCRGRERRRSPARRHRGGGRPAGADRRLQPRGLRGLPRPPSHRSRRRSADRRAGAPGHRHPLPRPAAVPRPRRDALPGDPPHPRALPRRLRPRLPGPGGRARAPARAAR